MVQRNHRNGNETDLERAPSRWGRQDASQSKDGNLAFKSPHCRVAASDEKFSGS